MRISRRKTFTDCLKLNISGCGMPQNFVEKTFVDGSQTSKFTKVFSLESFPPYSIPIKRYFGNFRQNYGDYTGLFIRLVFAIHFEILEPLRPYKFNFLLLRQKKAGNRPGPGGQHENESKPIKRRNGLANCEYHHSTDAWCLALSYLLVNTWFYSSCVE